MRRHGNLSRDIRMRLLLLACLLPLAITLPVRNGTTVVPPLPAVEPLVTTTLEPPAPVPVPATSVEPSTTMAAVSMRPKKLRIRKVKTTTTAPAQNSGKECAACDCSQCTDTVGNSTDERIALKKGPKFYLTVNGKSPNGRRLERLRRQCCCGRRCCGGGGGCCCGGGGGGGGCCCDCCGGGGGSFCNFANTYNFLSMICRNNTALLCPCYLSYCCCNNGGSRCCRNQSNNCCNCCTNQNNNCCCSSNNNQNNNSCCTSQSNPACNCNQNQCSNNQTQCCRQSTNCCTNQSGSGNCCGNQCGRNCRLSGCSCCSNNNTSCCKQSNNQSCCCNSKANTSCSDDNSGGCCGCGCCGCCMPCCDMQPRPCMCCPQRRCFRGCGCCCQRCCPYCNFCCNGMRNTAGAGTGRKKREITEKAAAAAASAKPARSTAARKMLAVTQRSFVIRVKRQNNYRETPQCPLCPCAWCSRSSNRNPMYDAPPRDDPPRDYARSMAPSIPRNGGGGGCRDAGCAAHRDGGTSRPRFRSYVGPPERHIGPYPANPEHTGGANPDGFHLHARMPQGGPVRGSGPFARALQMTSVFPWMRNWLSDQIRMRHRILGYDAY